jgi:hypothetical protein
MFVMGTNVPYNGQRKGLRAAMIGWIRCDFRGQHDEEYERGDQKHDHHQGEGKGKGKEGKKVKVREGTEGDYCAVIQVEYDLYKCTYLRGELKRVESVDQKCSDRSRLPLFRLK